MPLVRDLSQTWGRPDNDLPATSVGRKVGMTATLLGPNILLTLLNVWQPGNVLFATAWIVAAGTVIGTTFGMRQVAHPSVLTFGLGVLPSALTLAVVQYSSYGAPEDRVYQLTWITLGLFILVTTLVARPRTEPVSGSDGEVRWLARLGVLSFVGMLGASLLFFSTQGIPLLAFNAEQARVDASAGSGLTLSVISIGGVITAIALIASTQSAERFVRLAALALVGLAMMLQAMTGTRSAVISALVGALAAALATRRWRHAWVRIGAVMATGIGAAAILGQIRYAGGESSMQEIMVQRLAADPYSTSLVLAADFDDPRVQGLEIFRTAFATYLPGSQPLVGDVLKDQLHLQFTGGALAFPLSAEGFLVGGTFMVFVWGVIAALVPAFVQRWLDRSRDSSKVRKRLGILLGIFLGTTWAGVYGAGMATTLATYAFPGTVLIIVYAFLSNPRLTLPMRLTSMAPKQQSNS